jgi:peptide deformylase
MPQTNRPLAQATVRIITKLHVAPKVRPLTRAQAPSDGWLPVQFFTDLHIPMAQRPILRYPDPRLNTKAKPVAQVDDRIRRLVDDLLETMYAADGVGLAATQVDVHERVLVMDTSESRDRPRVLINPELIAKSDEMAVSDEGCLSVPAVYDKVTRHARVTVRALGRDGEPYEFEAEGLESVCVQHEMDHLEGHVFVEYLSRLKRDRIRNKMLKKAREEQDNQGAR